MYRIFRINCVLVFFFISSIATAQHLKQNLADKYYNLLSYYKAVNFYKELADKKKPKLNNIRRTAECYQKLNDSKNAERYYKKLINTNSATNDDYYNYSQILKTLGEYSKANEYIKLIEATVKYSILTNRHNEFKGYEVTLKKDSALYTINDAGINSEESDFSPFINKNEIYFTSSRRNVSGVNKKFAWDDSYFLDEYNGTFENGIFSNIKRMPRLIDSKYHEGPGVVTTDGNTMYITRSNYLDKELGKNTKREINLKIYISKKDDKGNWGNLENFPFNNDEYSVGHPALTNDGKTMYFVSDMPGGFGQTDIYQTQNENGVWSSPTNLGQAINSEGREMFPSIHDEVMFFSSDGNAGLGGLDIYFAVPQQDKYFTPQNLGYPINTQNDDFGIFVNDDLMSGFLSSNRFGGKGKVDIYAFTSKVPLGSQFSVEGVVVNKYTNVPITNVSLDVYDEMGQVFKTMKTDDKGRYKTPLLAGKTYKLQASKDDYANEIINLNTKDPNSKNLKADLKLIPSNVYVVAGIITDSDTKQPLNNVSVLIKDKQTGQEVLKTLTTNAGDFENILVKLKTGDLLDYEIQLQKEGYVIKNIKFIQILVKPGVIKINEFLDMSLQSNTANVEENNIFNINPIYFDLDKSDIRPDAQIELDKLVETMKTHNDIKIEIMAHTDCRATKIYNLALSKRRAIATANYLKEKGINPNRLKIKYLGETETVSNCSCESSNEGLCSEDQHQLNRRSNFKITNYYIDTKTNKKGM